MICFYISAGDDMVYLVERTTWQMIRGARATVLFSITTSTFLISVSTGQLLATCCRLDTIVQAAIGTDKSI